MGMILLYRRMLTRTKAGGVLFSLLAAAIFGVGPLGAADQPELACAKQTAVATVHTAAAGLGGLLAPLAGIPERTALVRAFIAPVRFYPDGSGYFYVYDASCVNIAHAEQKDLQGQDLSDYKDSRGTLVIRELAATAKAGGGFVEYFWVKPGATGEKRKLGYVEPIPGTDWFVGTGVYLPE